MISLSRIFILLGEILFLEACLIISKEISCPFKFLLNLPCPFCGMTRSFQALQHFQIKEAIYNNILLVPIILILLPLNLLFIAEIITKKDHTTKIYKYTLKHRNLIIIICLIMSLFSILINIYHGI